VNDVLTIDQHGLLTGARYLESPNQDARPTGCEPEALIIHCISLPPGEYGGPAVEEFFCNRLEPGAHPYFTEICELKVSSHFYISRRGEVMQFVPTICRAWHAGESRCMGRKEVNDFSVGIELEGLDTDGYTDEQYDTLADLSRALFFRHHLMGEDTVYGHSDISPGRKLDPGAQFDWDRYRAAL
jgi:AmpD protein